MLVTVDPGHRDRVESAELVTRDPRTIRLPGFELESDGSGGSDLGEPVRRLGDQLGEMLGASTSPD